MPSLSPVSHGIILRSLKRSVRRREKDRHPYLERSMMSQSVRARSRLSGEQSRERERNRRKREERENLDNPVKQSFHPCRAKNEETYPHTVLDPQWVLRGMLRRGSFARCTRRRRRHAAGCWTIGEKYRPEEAFELLGTEDRRGDREWWVRETTRFRAVT